MKIEAIVTLKTEAMSEPVKVATLSDPTDAQLLAVALTLAFRGVDIEVEVEVAVNVTSVAAPPE